MIRRVKLGMLCLCICAAGLAGPSPYVGFGARVLAESSPEAGGYILTVHPDRFQARGRVPDSGLVFRFTVPAGITLRGDGLPASLYSGSEEDRSIAQLELPVAAANTLDSDQLLIRRVGHFDSFLFCWFWDTTCADRGTDGFWEARLVRDGVGSLPLQLATPRLDELFMNSSMKKEIGVYTWPFVKMISGDHVELIYTGTVPARASGVIGPHLRAHFRYREAGCDAANDSCWTVLEDEQVQPLAIDPLPDPAFVRFLAPLDVEAGVPFTGAVVITDRYGNPRPLTGLVDLAGGVETTLVFQDEWRQELDVTYFEPGRYRVIPTLQGVQVRSEHQWTVAWDGPPPRHRMVGDTQIHAGCGRVQRKFDATRALGDHAGLFTSQRGALTYLQKVSGYDFGAFSPHAGRELGYELPPSVAADPMFQPEGACWGEGIPFPGIDGWWSETQRSTREYQESASASSDFVVFPAFEWGAQRVNDPWGDFSLQHSVVLFRELSPGEGHPVLPADVINISSQCLVRFLIKAGYSPHDALIIPHLMAPNIFNRDWQYAYAVAENPNDQIASVAEVEAYRTVLELFSARNHDLNLPVNRDTLTAFEGDRTLFPGPWTVRYGWRMAGAHLGLIGSSDNHTQMPGANDTPDEDGVRYTRNESTGTAIVLAQSRDRNGIYEALRTRGTYGTSGIRAWHDFRIGDARMGERVSTSAPSLSAEITVLAGMNVTEVQLWAGRVGDWFPPWRALVDEAPFSEQYDAQSTIANPVLSGAPQEWIYYVRAFFELPGEEDGDPEEALWSSPIWVTWSPP
jgi:hypothetical protein